MQDITLLAIDLAKNVFQLHGTDKAGQVVLRKRLKRNKFADFVANLKPCEIYMEACGTSNYWGLKFQDYGHRVRLINPLYVKPYVKRNKSDTKDAAAIAAAARDPEMVFCPLKTEAQQDMQSVHRIRSLLVQQRTALVNQIRGLLAEYGFVIPKGRGYVRSYMAEVLGDNPINLSSLMLGRVHELYKRLEYLDQQVEESDETISMLFEGSESCKRLGKIPGIGKLGATILSSNRNISFFAKK